MSTQPTPPTGPVFKFPTRCPMCHRDAGRKYVTKAGHVTPTGDTPAPKEAGKVRYYCTMCGFDWAERPLGKERQ